MRGDTVFGSVLELLESGPDRIDPPCPHFGHCGGCNFQHIAYDAQVAAKAGIITDALRRIGGIALDTVKVVPSPKEWAYRIRAEWISEPAAPLLGYRKRGSREPFDVVTCPILDPKLESTRLRLHGAVHAGDANVEGEIHASTGDQAVSVTPQIDGFSSGLVTLTINGERFGFDAMCFFQSNASILSALTDHVVSEMTHGRERVNGEAVDLFCGVGLFTILLARRFAHVTGVESQAKTGSYAHENAKAAGLGNVSISGLPVDQWLRRKGSQLEQPEAVLLDPPRTGAEPTVIEGILRLEPKRIVYVSCDPATLARDLKLLLAAGYLLGTVRGFDMFPQTHHVEVAATLVREAA
jgi:23S rRNA (uracil1939-C5)-methyltransferase